MMMPPACNRMSWKSDDELEMAYILRQMGKDEITQAMRLMRLELTRREQEGDQHVISDADRQLFRNA